ncbi:MAG TPA: phosphocholine cytidylyltransferase family protein [Longimicrobiales bacterium]|nr:phosphocholine cytidylyltransferase family protein [Longimicrobiales bacterium]
MRAIVLAAGLGSRLGAQSRGRPKALIEVGGKTLIEHQLEALSSEGIGPVVVVVGHGAEHVREALGEAVEYVENHRPSETNSLYSLWLAREWLEGDVLLLNSDLLFHPHILKKLLVADGNGLAFDSMSIPGAEGTKVGLNRGRVTDLGKDLPETGARGENLGLIKLNAEGSAALRRRADAIVAAGDHKAWVTEAVRSILSEVEVEGVNVAGTPWVEIDFPFDLDRARRSVWPAIERSLQPRYRAWQRARLASLVLIPFLLSVGAWTLGGLMGPSSIDWETLTPGSGLMVRVLKPEGGSQRWWVLRLGESIEVEPQGGSPLRLEVRPILATSLDTADVVIAAMLDGAPFRYEAERLRGDPEFRLPEDARRLEDLPPFLGKRERQKYVLPEGDHRLVIQYLVGTARAVIVRVRQPE